MEEPKDHRVVEQITINPQEQVYVSDRVRTFCYFGCSCYAQNGGCPPYSLDLESFTGLVGTYQSAIMFVWKGASPRDQADFQKFLREQEKFYFLERQKLFPLSFHSGPCRACGVLDALSCPVGETGKFKDCRAPKKRRCSLEACGVLVWKTLEESGLKTKLKIFKNKSQVDEAVSIGLLLVD